MTSPDNAGNADAFYSVAASSSWAPGRASAWWWLVLPIAATISLFVINQISIDFYKTRILPEGYGFLEFTQFWVLVAGFFVSLSLFRFHFVREQRLLTVAACLFAFTCFYTAGEEMSWGQHFLQWKTPEYWTALNRQDETNLHNVSAWFNQRPRLILEIGILVGGILLPLWRLAKGNFEHPFLTLFVPPAQILVVSVTSLAIKVFDHATKRCDNCDYLLPRPNEALESGIYLFLLYYLIMFYRRVRALEDAGVRKLPTV
jgi:hypothetical protein